MLFHQSLAIRALQKNHLNYIFILLYVIQIINGNYAEILFEISSSRYIHEFMNQFKDEYWKLFEYKLDVFSYFAKIFFQ